MFIQDCGKPKNAKRAIATNVVELGGTTAKAVGDKIARKMKEVGTAVDFMAYFAVIFTAAEMSKATFSKTAFWKAAVF